MLFCITRADAGADDLRKEINVEVRLSRHFFTYLQDHFLEF